jgi:hypothetical protein
MAGDMIMARSQAVPRASERPVTFRAAENLNPFDLAQLWADRAAWPMEDRTAYDELAELATMSALATWLVRWQPIAIHGAMLAGARPEAVAAALGSTVQAAYERWYEWASRQRGIVVSGTPGIAEDEYEAVDRRFAVELGKGANHSARPRCQHQRRPR